MALPDISIYHNAFFAKIDYADIDASVVWTDMLRHKETGQDVKLKRQMAYVSEIETIYYYDKFQLLVQPWTSLLNVIREDVGCEYNSVLLNKYKDGRDKINWHSDKEEQLGPEPVITSVNFGASRYMWFLEKATGIKTAYLLTHGDVLVMGEACQKNYLHAILPEKQVREPRISLTFRRVLA